MLTPSCSLFFFFLLPLLLSERGGGVYRKVISFSTHCRHSEGDGEGERRQRGGEGRWR